ncbi:AraC family transcriptional regulator [Polaromonas sp. SM01]|uniref:AraC family transcriptional regulator n=1 Tax=Polaromonas sp. SM01 TaxID=3085630 RepID=UPI00298144E7|nr:AraC family transcriptional regulator [Polaromonas sp. SM01]MDW5442668.1 AraC family transcriptional regulator [Polaromonas sp. SM01]
MQRAPHPSLRRFIRLVWLSAPAPGRQVTAPVREQMMPTGEMHLVFRLSGPSICIYNGPGDDAGSDMGHAVVNGPRARFYAKDVSAPSGAIGVQLLPGAAQALLGMPADELAGQHVRLEDIWSSGAGLMREQLLAAPSPDEKLRCLEMLLHRRLEATPTSATPPMVTLALQQFRTGSSVEEAVTQSGYSHRQFIRLFSPSVGLPPKLYCRVQRFQKALELMRGDIPARQPAFTEVALGAGYSDQPHFNREFLEFSGLTPEQYRAAQPVSPNHVPVPAKADHPRQR